MQAWVLTAALTKAKPRARSQLCFQGQAWLTILWYYDRDSRFFDSLRACDQGPVLPTWNSLSPDPGHSLSMDPG